MIGEKDNVGAGHERVKDAFKPRGFFCVEEQFNQGPLVLVLDRFPL